jgi:hypothetical protein
MDWVENDDILNSVIVRLAMGGEWEQDVLEDLFRSGPVAFRGNAGALRGILRKSSTKLQIAAEGIILTYVIRLIEGKVA